MTPEQAMMNALASAEPVDAVSFACNVNTGEIGIVFASPCNRDGQTDTLVIGFRLSHEQALEISDLLQQEIARLEEKMQKQLEAMATNSH